MTSMMILMIQLIGYAMFYSFDENVYEILI